MFLYLKKKNQTPWNLIKRIWLYFLTLQHFVHRLCLWETSTRVSRSTEGEWLWSTCCSRRLQYYSEILQGRHVLVHHLLPLASRRSTRANELSGNDCGADCVQLLQLTAGLSHRVKSICPGRFMVCFPPMNKLLYTVWVCVCVCEITGVACTGDRSAAFINSWGHDSPADDWLYLICHVRSVQTGPEGGAEFRLRENTNRHLRLSLVCFVAWVIFAVAVFFFLLPLCWTSSMFLFHSSVDQLEMFFSA